MAEDNALNKNPHPAGSLQTAVNPTQFQPYQNKINNNVPSKTTGTTVYSPTFISCITSSRGIIGASSPHHICHVASHPRKGCDVGNAVHCQSKGIGISVGGYCGSDVSPQGATQPPAMGSMPW